MKRLLRLCGLWLFVGLGLEPACAQATNAASKPPSAQLIAQARRCRELLQRSLVRFYLPGGVDSINGGYMESLDANGQFTLTGEKFLVMQARQLWFFSSLAAERYDTRALPAARVGYLFITQKMRDPQNLGYYSKVTDVGAVKDARKHAYLQAFAIYGFTSYYRATRDPGALQAAQQLFQVLEAKAYDRVNGGYHEFFYPNWQIIADSKETTYVGAVGTKTYNTHLHLMEAFSDLYKLWPDELLRRRLQELVNINANTVRIASCDSNVDAFSPDWKVVQEPRNLRTSYGHDIECAWLVMDAVRALQLPVAPYRNWAEALCKSSINFGYDKANGGFYSGGPLGQTADDTAKVFWVEAEALVSMLEMYRLTGNTEYYNMFGKTLDFVERFQAAPEGGWWSTRRADGSADNNTQRTSPWQGGYHAGRALMISARWLEDLARR